MNKLLCFMWGHVPVILYTVKTPTLISYTVKKSILTLNGIHKTAVIINKCQHCGVRL